MKILAGQLFCHTTLGMTLRGVLLNCFSAVAKEGFLLFINIRCLAMFIAMKSPLISLSSHSM